MNNKLQVFNNEKLNLQVRAIQNGDGSISINAEDTARGFGWTTVAKSGNEVVRWNRVNQYIEELNFPHKCGKGDYIPESLFYLLGMKANNDVARKFQTWLAVDVIPQIRKTGSYKSNQNSINPELKEKEIEARLKNARAREANILLKICNNPNLSKEYVQVLQSKATEIITGQAILTLPVAERKTYSATEIGNKLGISANKVGSLANKHNLKNDEYGKFFHDKSPYSAKEVESFRYYEEVIPVLKSLI
ncbi:Bro-N domain-containing protein [Clostridium cadaveris]|uniref:BRO-N domain-containing protein n=1 Tax=Clostridium cadaveris TaxID=1529 RepID=UPI003996A1AF